MIWIFQACRFFRASQADRPQDASIDLADQNDSNLRKRNCNSPGWNVSCKSSAKIAIDWQKSPKLKKVKP